MIKLIDNYEIHGNSYDYVLVQNSGKVDKQGNPVYKNLGYFRSIKSCIKACYRAMCLKAVEEEVLTLTEALDRFDAIYLKLENIIPRCFSEEAERELERRCGNDR